MGLSYEAANFVRQLHSCFEDILTKIKKSNIMVEITIRSKQKKVV